MSAPEIVNPEHKCLKCGRKLRPNYRTPIVRTWHELPQRGCSARQRVEGAPMIATCELPLRLDGSRAVCEAGHSEPAIQRHEHGPREIVGYGIRDRNAFDTLGCATSFAHAAAETGLRFKWKAQA